ncbi:hypothetical protein PGQ11_015618 [Apiospora arundinis]|uniref:Uncharacterized protein n=1 Tax=Apiospora arundinis TaxID=335852 RepID=A0ABR2HMB4_9PEZI
MGIITRAVAALPFLLIAAWCFREMALDQLDASARPSAESGFIEWGHGKNKVAILDHFHGVPFLDQLWRGGTAVFAVSAFGMDGVAAWQVFTFLVDLGPLYAIWILESHRGANAWSPAYIPTVFTLAAQVLGAGGTMSVFYFLCLVFSPSASELASKTPAPRRTVWSRANVLLLPLVLALHTAEVFAMYLSPSYEARHYWVWAWQLTPLWIGVGNVVAGQALLKLLPPSGSPRIPQQQRSSAFVASIVSKTLLAVLASVSVAVWLYTILSAPHPLAALFVPGPEPQDGLVLRSRKSLQADEVGVFAGSFLWLAYSFADLYLANLVNLGELLGCAAALPVATLVLGPGGTFAAGWYMRERMLGSA